VTLDWPHMLASLLIILVVMQGLERVPRYREGSMGRRLAMLAGVLFVVLLIFNAIWPYGSGAHGA